MTNWNYPKSCLVSVHMQKRRWNVLVAHPLRDHWCHQKFLFGNSKVYWFCGLWMVMIQKQQHSYYFKKLDIILDYNRLLPQGMCKPHYNNNDFFPHRQVYFIVIIKNPITFKNPITKMGVAHAFEHYSNVE